MFSKTLDSKLTYTDNDGNSVVDLGAGIFDSNKAMSQICSAYRIPHEFEMRPDLVSKALYGTMDYTEMVLKYSLIQNPFSIEFDDVIFSVSSSYIYNPVTDLTAAANDGATFVRNYHKYIDKSKLPTSVGSDKDETKISSAHEVNISKTKNTGITIENGKVYFGDTKISPENSSDLCVNSGDTLGEFLNVALQNNN